MRASGRQGGSLVGWLSAERRRRLGGALAAGAAVVASFALLVAGLRERNETRSAFPREQGRLEIEGLAAPARIDRDAHGVPHVEAESEEDAFVALGFVHAQDRLAQMIGLRAAARGRSAERIGAAALEADRLARTLGIGRLADAQLPRLSRRTRGVLEAYARGVNARLALIERGDVERPLALQRFETPLEPWRPADSLAVLKAWCWALESSVDATLLLSDLIRELGADRARPFFPEEGSLPVPGTTVRRAPFEADPLRRALGLEGQSIGSSAFVIGGAHTRSGRPIVAVDTHLETRAPAHFHLAHLRGGSLDVAGAALPGVPVFWIGRNAHVAWASIHARAVVTDLYDETLSSNPPGRYHDGRRWRELEQRVERIEVAGGEGVNLVTRSTHHGPLLEAGAEQEPSSEALAVAWVGARIDGPSGIGSLLGVARATNAAELIDALRSHHEPVLTVVYADADGAAGLQVAGWIPQRELSPELLPLPGRARWYDWHERVPFDALPSARLEDGEGWQVAADNRLARGIRNEPIDWLWQPGARARRLGRLLRAAMAEGPVDLRRVAALQSDVGLERGRQLIDAALSLVDYDAGTHGLGPEAAELAELLDGWNGEVDAGSIGAAAYQTFLLSLARALFEDALGRGLLDRYLALSRADPEHVVFEVVEAAARGGGDSWSDPATVEKAVRHSLRSAWLDLSFRFGSNRGKWNWGRLHPLRFRPVPLLAGVLPEPPGLGPFAYGGDASTVNVAGYDLSHPFDVRVASTLRFAVDTASLDQALYSLAPGQSEHPGHPHFRGGLDRWLVGRPSLLVTGQLLVEEATVAQLRLEPVR